MIEPFDIGYPDRFGSCHIGLYQPIENRFFLTLCDIQQARDIALIVSNRYPLFLVDLVAADNYCENLIDNQCCENWSLPSTQIVETTINKYANTIIKADRLIQYQTDCNFVNEKQYLQMCWYYLKTVDYISSKYIYGWRIRKFMADVFDFQDQENTILLNLKKQIMAELFLSKDMDSTRIVIENMMAQAKNNLELKNDLVL